MPIDITEALVRALVLHFETDLVGEAPAGITKPSTLATGGISEGFAYQDDRMEPPIIEVSAPVTGDRNGHTPRQIASQRVELDGTPTADPAEPNFLYTFSVAEIIIPLTVRVTAKSKIKRAEIDAALDVWMAGDVDNGVPYIETPALTDYYDQQFSFFRSGTTQRMDNPQQVGRDDFVSVREISGTGGEIFQYIASSFTDLRLRLSVVEGGRDFPATPHETITVFDSTT